MKTAWFYILTSFATCAFALSDLLQFSREELKTSKLETIVVIEIDNKVNFDSNIKTLCSKVSQKLGTFRRISNLFGT